jgi:hypothetical protein
MRTTENPLIDNHDEQAVASEIERDLAEVLDFLLAYTKPHVSDVFATIPQLYDCIQSMRSCNGGSLSNHQEVLIKRYYEIHFDYSTEFKNTSVRPFLFGELVLFKASI